MFYYISGTLAHKGDNFLVIDAAGVGYQVYTSLSCLERLGAVGEEVKVYTYLHVREGIFDIYGFASHEDMNMFTLLITVSGVGPRAALAILSAMPSETLALSIVSGDSKALTRAQGIGGKTAQRIILELKDKIKNEDMLTSDGQEAAVLSHGGATSEALEALMVLGYSAGEARQALSGIDVSMDLELIIKQALKKLVR